METNVSLDVVWDTGLIEEYDGDFEPIDLAAFTDEWAAWNWLKDREGNGVWIPAIRKRWIPKNIPEPVVYREKR